MRLTLLALVSSLLLLETVAALNINWQKYGTRIIAAVGNMKPRRDKRAPFSTAFVFYVQAAERTMIPLFKDTKHKALTIVVPTNTVFKQYIEHYGGDVMDPELQGTPAWIDRWNDQFEYFFLKNVTFSTTELVVGETVLFDTYKTSPAGDWPLQMAVRKEAALVEKALVQNITYSGTFFAAAGSSGNITLPDFEIPEWTRAHSADFWPVQPKSLSASMSLLNNTAWATLRNRLSAVAALDSQQDFTLFLPPSEAVASALQTLPASELSAFVDAHLVQNERVLLKNAEQTFGPVTATNKWVAVGSVNATVLGQDVLTSGGLIQVIDRSLYVPKNGTASAVGGREEL